jgi:hypothetical protein
MSVLSSPAISSLAVALLNRQLVLPNTVSRVPGAEYSGPSGGQVVVRVPHVREAKEQTVAGEVIDFDGVDETPITTTVRHLYDATRIDAEDLTLNVESFGKQILAPQVASVATGAEDVLAGAMNGLDEDSEVTWGDDPDDPEADIATLLAIREKLTTNDVPAGNRFLAVSPSIATRLLGTGRFVEADARGSSTALTEAVLGRLYGLTVVESNAINEGTSVGYHTGAFAFASFPPASPLDGTSSSTAEDGGVALRATQAYLADRLSNASVVHTFVGAVVVSEDEEGEIVKRAIRVGPEGS